MQRVFNRGLFQPLISGLRLTGLMAPQAQSQRAFAATAGSDSVQYSVQDHPFWRNSATVILAAKADSTLVEPDLGDDNSHSNGGLPKSDFDYKVLMLEKSKRSKFMAGADVFPGGTVCEADFSLEWANVFRYCTKRDMGEVLKDLNIGRKRPPLLAEVHSRTAIPLDLGFRIAAIRETFEESGVLLAKGSRMPNVEDSVIEEFRGKVKKDPNKFATYCKDLQIVPDVWALQEWSNWLTPVLENMTGKSAPYKPYRFDTIFYLCCLDWIPLVKCDGKETVDAKWVSPHEYFSEEEVKFGPQPFEMARIYNFPKIAVLHIFAAQRATLGLERFMSVLLECKDGVIAVLPGDDLYPAKPDYEGTKTSKALPHSIEELRTVTKRHHRQEFPSASNRSFYVCNIEFKYGQPVPHRRLENMGGYM